MVDIPVSSAVSVTRASVAAEAIVGAKLWEEAVNHSVSQISLGGRKQKWQACSQRRE